MINFGDVLTAMVTPYDDNLKLDLKKARKLASYLVNNGSDGLVVLGTTGEVPTLKLEEKIELLKTVLDEVEDKATVIAGTGSYSTEDSIFMSKKAEELGVDGIMLVTPYYNKPTQTGLYNHFATIASSTSLPIILYNVPDRTSRNIEPETVLKLAGVDNIIGIKEASGKLDQVSTLSRILPEDFSIYSGDDILTLPILAVGGKGVISVASHLVGKEIKEMIQYFKNNELEKAIKMNKKLGPIFKIMFMMTNPIPVKTALNLTGIDVGSLRPPLYEMDEEEKNLLKNALHEYNLL